MPTKWLGINTHTTTKSGPSSVPHLHKSWLLSFVLAIHTEVQYISRVFYVRYISRPNVIATEYFFKVILIMFFALYKYSLYSLYKYSLYSLYKYSLIRIHTVLCYRYSMHTHARNPIFPTYYLHTDHPFFLRTHHDYILPLGIRSPFTFLFTPF